MSAKNSAFSGIYLDCMATTPMLPEVEQAMRKFFCQEFGNPNSNTHIMGQKAKSFVENARIDMATMLGANYNEIIFTSGATEGNNFVLKGIRPKHIITSKIEHKSVLSTCRYLETEGVKVDYLSVDSKGLVSLAELQEKISTETSIVSVMLANNEIGSIQPIEQVAQICKKFSVPLHVDAAQAIGKIPVNLKDSDIDFLTISAHKFYGPKGIGVVYIKNDKQASITPLIHGGGQEFGLRSGTHNVPSIIGMKTAMEVSLKSVDEEMIKLNSFKERIVSSLSSVCSDFKINGDLKEGLANNLSITFKSIDVEELMESCPDIFFSTSSACSSGSSHPSYVLKAIGLSDFEAQNTIRIGMGKFTSSECVDYFIEKLKKNILGQSKLS